MELRKLKNNHFDKGLQLSVEARLRIGYIIIVIMLLYSAYAVYFNITREHLEGSARTCAKSCSAYINFDLDDMLIESYHNIGLLPNPWSLPNSERDKQL